LKSLRRELELAKEQSNIFQRDHIEHLEEKKRIENELKSTQQRLREYEERSTDLAKHSEELTNSLHKERETNAKLKSKIDQLEEDKQEILNAISENDSKSKLMENEQQLISVKRENEILKQQNSELISRLSEVGQVDGLNNEIRILKEALETAKIHEQTLHKQLLKEKSENHPEFESKYNSLKSEHEKLVLAVDRSRSVENELLQRNEQLENQLEQMNEEKEKQNESTNKLLQDLVIAKSDAQRFENELKTIQTRG